jgi:hypothetical protein
MISYSQYCKLFEEYTPQPGTRYGSNPGGVHVHQQTGEKYYVKFPRSPEQAHVEAATADLYNALGIRTLNPEVKEIGGKTALVTKWNPSLHSLQSSRDYHAEIQNPEREKELALMHHAAIMTANRDVVGMDYTNVMKDQHTGQLVSADQGGSMHYRAQGAPKAFEADIADVHSFQNPEYESGKVFSRVNPATLKETSAKLKDLTDDTIDSIMQKHGLSHLAPVVKARRDMLVKHYQ